MSGQQRAGTNIDPGAGAELLVSLLVVPQQYQVCICAGFNLSSLILFAVCPSPAAREPPYHSPDLLHFLGGKINLSALK